MVNVIPPSHVDEVPVVEPNQHDDVPVVLEPVLVDEDEDPKEDEFKEEEGPQEEEDDMEIDIDKDENEPELTYPYEEVDPLNPLSPASESKPNDKIKAENPIEHGDETVPANVHEVVRSSVEQGTTIIEKLVEKLGNTEDKVECKKLMKELEEARFSNTFLRDFCLKKDRMKLSMFRLKMRRVHHLSRENLLEIHSSLDSTVPRWDYDPGKLWCCSGFTVRCMPLKSAPMTQAAIPRMIKDSVYAAIAAERARQANVKNDASGSGPVRGQDATPVVRECTFTGFMKCNPTVFRGVKRAVEFQRWFEKTESVFEISRCAQGKKTVNLMPWTEMKQPMTTEFCPIEEVQIMEHELWNLKVKEYY
nr:hypothetical protein [Tanacetum cinerariifolium]